RPRWRVAARGAVRIGRGIRRERHAVDVRVLVADRLGPGRGHGLAGARCGLRRGAQAVSVGVPAERDRVRASDGERDAGLRLLGCRREAAGRTFVLIVRGPRATRLLLAEPVALAVVRGALVVPTA